MKKKIWYTYLIGWKAHDLWYYGYRGSIEPEKDLWVKYFTSSKCVKGIRLKHGEPDCIRIHKLFTSDTDARIFENKFLRRVRAVKSKRWLNQHDSGDNWVSKKGKIPSSKHRENVSQSLKGQRWWTNGICQMKSYECPGEGWVIGRIKGQLSEEGRLSRSQKLSETKWWYKEGQRTRSKECPGAGWSNNKGPDRDETRLKKSKTRTGMKHSSETKEKIKNSHLQRNRTNVL